MKVDLASGERVSCLLKFTIEESPSAVSFESTFDCKDGVPGGWGKLEFEIRGHELYFRDILMGRYIENRIELAFDSHGVEWTAKFEHDGGDLLFEEVEAMGSAGVKYMGALGKER